MRRADGATGCSALSWVRAGAHVLVLTALAVMAVLGQNRLSGEVVLRLSETHGLHRSDFVVAAVWLLGVLLSLPWSRPTRRDAARRPR